MKLETSASYKGVKNLLENCLHAEAGDSVLLVAEDPALGYVDASVISDITEHATDMGLKIIHFDAPIVDDVSNLPLDLIKAAKQADRVIFCARCGDQLRFTSCAWSAPTAICYVLDGELMGKPYATIDHNAMISLKKRIDNWLATAQEIVITCPNGTNLSGYDIMGQRSEMLDVTICRFPMVVFRPVLADAFSGKIAITKFVIGTGVRMYEPFAATIDSTVSMMIDKGRIEGFVGEKQAVEVIKKHYSDIAGRFELDEQKVHSWHAGIHPGCAYNEPADDNFVRWGNGAFGNPRVLHFHSCADETPGEIAVNIFDPTVTVDGIKAWENGTLHPERIPGCTELYLRYPELQTLFANPETAIGVDNASSVAPDNDASISTDDTANNNANNKANNNTLFSGSSSRVNSDRQSDVVSSH